MAQQLKLGYKASAEQFGPRELVELAVLAEQHGMDRALIDQCDARVSIPGSDAVDSLNVAAATAVLLGQWWRG